MRWFNNNKCTVFVSQFIFIDKNGMFCRFDTQCDNMRQQSFNMEQTTMAIQSAKDTQVVIGAMKTGVKEIKKEYKKINIDKIDVRI